MSTSKTRFAQPDETMPFRRHLKKAVKYLNIALPTFTGTFTATLPEEKRWRIEVCIPGRTFVPTTDPIEFTLDAPTWSLGRSMAAHITFGRIYEVYNKDLEDTVYRICGRRDHQWEMVRTRKDESIASYIQDMDQHIRRLENQMCDSMKETRKLIIRNIELEDEIKATRDGYEEEISVLLERYEKLKKKLERAEEKLDQGENLHNEDSDAAFISNDADYEDDDEEEDMMESSTDQNF